MPALIEPRNFQRSCRVTAAEARRIDEAARKDERSSSAWLRIAAMEKIQREERINE